LPYNEGEVQVGPLAAPVIAEAPSAIADQSPRASEGCSAGVSSDQMNTKTIGRVRARHTKKKPLWV
jgi:hypothetical protein